MATTYGLPNQIPIANVLSLALLTAGYAPARYIGSVAIAAGQQYVSDGIIWNSQSSGSSSLRIQSIRPKFASFGNSLNARNALGETSAGYWSAWGFVTWIHALSGAAFDRARTNAFSWGAQGNGTNQETIDALGCYSWTGAQVGTSAPYSMLNHIGSVIQQFIDVPDVVYLASMTENDIGINATPVASQIQAGLWQVIQQIRQAWPNALIIVATPGPSTFYTTAAQHAAFQQVTAWVQSLPGLDSHIFVENNTSMIQFGTADQPVLNYTSDNNVHQNERGAYVRAKAFLGSPLGALLPNKLSVPQQPFNATTPAKTFQRNPNFALTGAPGTAISGTTYTSYDWYGDTNVAATVSANALGLGVNVTLQATGALSSGAGMGVTSDAQTTTVPNSATLIAMAQVTVLNPSNLALVSLGVNYVGGSASTYGLWYQGTFLTAYPQGLSDIWQAGDTFVLTSPPLTPGSTNTTVGYTSVKPVACTTLVPGTPASLQPSIQITAQNVVQVGSNAPVSITITSGLTYQNATSGAQQIVITGSATWTSLAITRSGVVVPLPASNSIVVLAPSDVLTPTYTAGAPVFNMLQLN